MVWSRVADNVSTSYGLWIDGTGCGAEFSKLVIWGFKYGVRLNAEYCEFRQVDCSGNGVGAYLNVSNVASATQTIDVLFNRCRFSRNAAYGLWIQNGQKHHLP